MSPARVRFEPSGREVLVAPGTFLTAAAVRAGEPIVHDCDGQGACGTCRVRIETGMEALTPLDDLERTQLGREADRGWRLCCRLRVQGDVRVRVPRGGPAYPPELQRGG